MLNKALPAIILLCALLLLLILTLTSCSSSITDWKISSKSYPKQTVLCEYSYDGSYHSFEDSCNKYNIGDTIKH